MPYHLKSTPHQRALLPLIGLQGAVSSLGSFIGFFVIDTQDRHAIFRYTASTLTTAWATIFLTYFFGLRFHLCGRRLLRLGFLIPGLLLLFSERSVAMTAIAFGAFVGMTAGARHSLEMNLLPDAARDSYAARTGTLSAVCGVALYFARKSCNAQNRTHWLGRSCMVVALSFVQQGASVWLSALYIVHSILKATGTPFLAASQQALSVYSTSTANSRIASSHVS